jgi:uncharacterized protein YeaO (DUF488 family)
MAIRVVRLGSPRAPGEGLRIGTVRRPPRGVPKAEYASRDLYDAWLPELAPSEMLLNQAQQVADEREWRAPTEPISPSAATARMKPGATVRC